VKTNARVIALVGLAMVGGQNPRAGRIVIVTGTGQKRSSGAKGRKGTEGTEL
jgi:hypothetical protein